MASTDAALFKANFKPGFYRESTRYAEEGRWYEGDKVRFREGRPENIRGWTKRSTTTFEGTARDLLLWTDNDTQRLAAWGTEKKLYVYVNDEITDITPIVSVRPATSAFNTSIGSGRVRVSIASHGRVVGDYVEVSSTTSIGSNIVLSSAGFGGPVYPVVSVSGLHEFFISVASAAVATQVSAGDGEVRFLLGTQLADSISGLGFGAGVYNAGVSTTGARAWNQPTSSSDITFLGNQWSLDTFGEDMLACRRGSRIYFWDRDGAATPQRATLVTASPSVNDFILVSPDNQQVISLGCTGVAAPYSPLRVRWSNARDYTNWTPSVSSTAGEIDLTDGTRLIGGIRSRNQITVWTDNAVYGMQYVGGGYIYNTKQLGTNCGLIGPHAAVDYDGRSFWMSNNNFYAYDGQVRNLNASVRRYVYENINKNQYDKVFAGVNSEFKEIIWLYPSLNSNECDSYVIFNPEEGHWVFGTTKWSTFKDRNVFDNPITTGTDNYLYDAEPADTYTGDGGAIPSYIESADFDMEEGVDIMFLDKIIPDFTINNGTINFTIKTKDYPSGTEKIKGPYTINSGTRKIDLRARGRQAKVRVSTASQGVQWRWGAVRMSAQKDGFR